MSRIPAVIITLAFISCAQTSRILGIFPLTTGKSHYILGSALMRALAERGHDVTVISGYGEKDPPKGKYRDILLPDVKDHFMTKFANLNFFELGDNPVIALPVWAYVISDLGETILKNKEVRALIDSGEKFDAVIVEQFYNDEHKALAHHFNATQIIFSTIGANFWVNSLVANPSPLAYVPDHFLNYLPQMSFCERLSNTLYYFLQLVTHHWYLYPIQSISAQKNIPNSPDYYKSLYNASLVLLNSHPSLNQPVPLVPNMVEIGGFHIKPPKKLPDDLQNFLDTATEGVIYFSLGSNIRSADLPPEKREALLRTFAKLKEKVLWKWEDDVLPGQPPNVKLGKWLPQQSILAHPNVKLFITHGGLLSKTETVYFGVPVLTIPVYGDQKSNALSMQQSGYGRMVPFMELTEELLTNEINELLTNSKYAEAAKLRSKLFHDRLTKPMDTAMYWIEYVIRHGGTHLRVAGIDLPWYQYLLLDVIAFIGAVLLISLLLIRFTMKKICRKLCGKKQTKKEKQN